MLATLRGEYYNNVITEVSVICHPEPVTLKVIPWLGSEPIVWQFTNCPYPMPLRKIIADAGNVLTETGEQITSVQIGY